MYKTRISDLEKEIATLRKQGEKVRQMHINSRKSFYNNQAELIGKVMTIVFKLELVHCRATPFTFNREKVMLDFYDYSIEGGLDRCLEHAMRILSESEE